MFIHNEQLLKIRWAKLKYFSKKLEKNQGGVHLKPFALGHSMFNVIKMLNILM